MRHSNQILDGSRRVGHWPALLLTCMLALSLLVMTPAQLSAQSNDEEGVLVVRVLPESPAAEAGLRRGDIILSVDGQPVNSAADLREVIAAYGVGDEIELFYRHGSEERSVTAVLASIDGRTLLGVQPYQEMTSPPRREREQPKEWNLPQETPEASPEEMPRFRFEELEPGAQIFEILEDSPAAAAGLQLGDVIVAVDGQEVTSPEDLVEMIGSYAPEQTVTLTVMRGDEEVSADVTLAAREDDAERGFLGVQIGPVFSGDMRWEEDGVPFRFDMPFAPDGMFMMSGVLVRDVAEGSPADAAGLEPGDWITEVNGQAMEDFEDLQNLIDAAQPGDQMELTVVSRPLPMFRPGAEMDEPESRTLTITLDESPTGGAYLGISVMPARFHMHEMAPPAPDAPEENSTSGEEQGNMMMSPQL